MKKLGISVSYCKVNNMVNYGAYGGLDTVEPRSISGHFLNFLTESCEIWVYHLSVLSLGFASLYCLKILKRKKSVDVSFLMLRRI